MWKLGHFEANFQPLGHTGELWIFCYTVSNVKLNDRPHRPNRHDLHPERAPARDGTAPSEMSGCLSEVMRETGKLYPLRHMVRHRVPPPYQDCEVQVNLFQTVKAAVTVRQATTAKRLLDGQLLLRMEARLDILNAKEAA